jgi:hypothetical protein
MDQRLLEQIDACRHGPDGLPSEDLRAPELTELSAALTRSDEAALRAWSRVVAAEAGIEAALHDVSVPDDLSERLLVALKAAEQGEPADAAALHRYQNAGSATWAAAAPASTADIRAKADRARPARVRRRAWLGWSIAAATVAAAACAAFVLLHSWSPTFVTQDEVAQHIHGLYDAEITQSAASEWTAGAPVHELPFFASDQFPQPKRWRELRVGGYAATAYDLPREAFGNPPPRSLKRATLVVIDRRVRGLGSAPPQDPLFTQGLRIGVWQTETQVFALVVEGSPDDYQLLIGSQGSFT